MAGDGPGLYLRELDQIGRPADLVAYLRGTPFRHVAFHANAEGQSKTIAWARAVHSAGFPVDVYTTPAGLTPDRYRAQVAALRRLADRSGAREVVLDMEAPWRGADQNLVLDCCRQAAAGGRGARVTTVPGHPVVATVARLQAAAISVQVYDRFNRYSADRVRAICASARRRAPRCDFDLPGWNKTPERLERHLLAIPPCGLTRYWMADNPGVDDLPGDALLRVIAQCDPSLRLP